MTKIAGVLVHFRLMGDEAKALHDLCAQEMREPAQQTRFLLIQDLKRLGWLSDDGKFIDKNESLPSTE